MIQTSINKIMKQKSKILIVDDDLAMRVALEGLLKHQGYELAIATNGPDALSKAVQIIPDVILLDVMMPGMDGYEVCQRVRANSLLAKIPIIMLTTLNDRESRLQGIQAGADDFIAKPYDSLELQTRLRTITHLNRYRLLLTEQKKFEWVVDLVNEAVLVLNQQTHIIYANSQARFYLNLQDKIRQNFLEIATKFYNCEPKEAWMNWLEPTEQSAPFYLVCPETSTSQAFWLQVNVRKMETGTEEKYLIHLRDVTNTILVKRQRWTFHGQINHKLRTPLIPLTTAIRYLKDNFSRLPEAKMKEFLEMADAGATRLQSEIEQSLEYLNLSQLSMEGQGLCCLTDIQAIATSIKERLAIEWVEFFQKEIENPEKTYLSLSKMGIELVLTELFSNAKKFHPNKSPHLKINIAAVSKGIRLQICDDGLTLSPHQLAQMWMPYYQGEKYFTGEAKGMGLGLSMVASLIWEVGGTCNAYNCTDGKGIMIELILPLSKLKIFEYLAAL